ncbi:MAG: ABC transporter permease [Clostridium sp.]
MLENTKMGNENLSKELFKSINSKEIIEDISDERRSRNTFSNIKRVLKTNKMAVVCLSMIIIIVIASMLAFLSPYEPDALDLVNKLQKPSLSHLFGTDDLGRDYFTRALYGAQVSLIVGIFSMIIAVTIGTLVGTISGYVGGKLDSVLMRCIDILMSIPSFLLIIIINAYVKPSIATIVIIIGAFGWMGVARIVRAETLKLKESEFVLASKNLGGKNSHIILKHIIPNITSSVTVAATISIASSILVESSLSFLGLGVQLPKASLGSMLQNAQAYMMESPLLPIFPGLLILIIVLSFNVLGDVFRDALDVKSLDK